MEKQCKKIKICLLLCFFLGACYTTKHGFKDTCHSPTESIWTPKSKDYDYIKYDSISYLVFEGMYKDTFNISLNREIVFHKFLKSVKSLEVITEIIPLKTNFKKSLLEVSLLNERSCFKLTLKKNFRYCYITKNKNYWSLEYSNFKREYR